MANRDNPHGLRPLLRSLSGGHVSINQYQKDVSMATAIFIWDVVNRENDENLAPGGTPGTTTYQGVSLNYGAALTATDHQVIDSPDAIFEAQDNADTDGFAEADMGLNCDLEFNAGSTTDEISGHEIDESAINTTATLDVKLLRLYAVPDNAFGANGRIEVMINKHRLGNAVAGV
jgi:hypothetical protein